MSFIPVPSRGTAPAIRALLPLRRLFGLLGLAGQLGGVPEEVVEVRVLLQVLGLEVVGPEHPEVVLHEVRALLLDRDRALLEDRVVRPLILLLARLDRFGLDPSLRRIVDAARKVAVRVDGSAWCEDAVEHGTTSFSGSPTQERILPPGYENALGEYRADVAPRRRGVDLPATPTLTRGDRGSVDGAHAVPGRLGRRRPAADLPAQSGRRGRAS